jgi:hypothetical protein
VDRRCKEFTRHSICMLSGMYSHRHIREFRTAWDAGARHGVRTNSCIISSLTETTNNFFLHTHECVVKFAEKIRHVILLKFAVGLDERL